MISRRNCNPKRQRGFHSSEESLAATGVRRCGGVILSAAKNLLRHPCGVVILIAAKNLFQQPSRAPLRLADVLGK
jgi:hypothetical protein